MLAMTTPRKGRQGRKDGAKKPNRTGVPFYVNIEPAIDEAMARYLDSTEPRVSKTAAAESALKAFLRSKGFWPPAGSEGGE